MRDIGAFNRAMARNRSDKDYERMSGLLDNSQKMYGKQCEEIKRLSAENRRLRCKLSRKQGKVT